MIARPQMIFGSLMLAVAAFVAWVLWSLPNWSRPGLFFSVTVVPSFRDSAEAARVVSSFRMQALLHVVIGFGLVVVVGLVLAGGMRFGVNGLSLDRVRAEIGRLMANSFGSVRN